jgi:hypothetical protein
MQFVTHQLRLKLSALDRTYGNRERFLFNTLSRQRVGRKFFPVKCVPLFFLPKIKRSPHTSSSAEVRSKWSYTAYSTPCIFMVWCLIKCRKIYMYLWDYKIWDDIRDTVIGLRSGRQRNHPSVSGRRKRLYCSSVKRSDGLLGSHCILLNGYQKHFPYS